MRLRRIAVLASVAAAALCLAQPAGAQDKRRAAPAAAVPKGWRTFNVDDGGFSLAFPGDPKLQETTVDTEAGPIVARMYILEVSETLAYMCGFNDYPPGVLDPDPESVLDGARNGAVQNVGGRLKQEKKITVDGHPGRELVIETPGGMVTYGRAYLVNGRLIQALVVMKSDAVDMRNVRAFLDSFRLRKVSPRR